jgi:hypothetical protein
MDPTILIAIAALACPIGMGAMMWMMGRQGGHQGMNMGATPPVTREQSLAALQTQKDALEKQIHELETVQALEQRRDQLARKMPAQQEESQA